MTVENGDYTQDPRFACYEGIKGSGEKEKCRSKETEEIQEALTG
jgi:hypothetical protein